MATVFTTEINRLREQLDRLIAKRDAQIVKLRSAGMRNWEIAEIHGVTRARVEQILKKAQAA